MTAYCGYCGKECESVIQWEDYSFSHTMGYEERFDYWYESTCCQAVCYVDPELCVEYIPTTFGEEPNL